MHETQRQQSDVKVERVCGKQSLDHRPKPEAAAGFHLHPGKGIGDAAVDDGIAYIEQHHLHHPMGKEILHKGDAKATDVISRQADHVHGVNQGCFPGSDPPAHHQQNHIGQQTQQDEGKQVHIQGEAPERIDQHRRKRHIEHNVGQHFAVLLVKQARPLEEIPQDNKKN